MKEQIELLENLARTYLVMAQAMNAADNLVSGRAYAKQGQVAALKAIELKNEWNSDMTKEYKIAA